MKVSPLYRQRGSFHGLELIYVFQRIEDVDKYRATKTDFALQSAILDYWTSFAATGDPNGAGGTVWQPYDTELDN